MQLRRKDLHLGSDAGGPPGLCRSSRILGSQRLPSADSILSTGGHVKVDQDDSQPLAVDDLGWPHRCSECDVSQSGFLILFDSSAVSLLASAAAGDK